MRILLDSLNEQFTRTHERSVQFVSNIPAEILYVRPRELPKTFTMFTCGEYILRSAAAVEQCFGGLTTRLWDDPFEWTLPEKLSTPELVIEYLDETNATRNKGMAFLLDDSDLNRMIPAPKELVSVHSLLISTIARAEHFQGRAFGIFQYFSDEKLPIA